MTLIRHRDLLLAFVRRQISLRYRQSFMGFGWALFPPLATMGMATLVFDKIARIETGGEIPYPLFTLAALAPWTYFANSLASGVPSVTQATAMLVRIPFPRVILPLSVLGTGLVDLALASGVFVAFVYIAGYSLPSTALWFPVLVILETILIAGVLLFTSALNVFARDVRLAVPILVQLWLFLTPVMYPLSSVPKGLRSWYLANPMTGVVESFRRALLPPGGGLQADLLLPAAVGAVALLALGWWYFCSTESRFADVV